MAESGSGAASPQRGSGAAPPHAKSNFLIAGIGGSAGSIPAFQTFFRNVRPDSGMAYVVILHLSPEHESHLAEVLQVSASIPVTQVVDAVHVVPDHVYVIPPNRSLAMRDGMLVASAVTSFEERRAPIDIFFRALAETHDSRAVCIVLSGSGSDGSMGLRRVKEYNGLVLVQDPDEAQFDEMPRSSIATGLVDFVLPTAKMPNRITAYRDQVFATAPTFDEESDEDERALTDIFALLRVRTGHDFTNYKRATVMRRLRRRLAIRELAQLGDYVQFLRDVAGEAEALLRELLISVTNFFRDPEVWKKVEETVIPALFRGKAAGDHVRVWVAGCATGEEAYSVAMLLADAMAKMPAPPEVQVFGTDLDEDAIAKAREGVYSNAEIADVPPERLRRYFQKEQDDCFRVRRELRELVLFAAHNLIKDPPFSHLDFITCRNVLIYFNRTAQDRTMEVMHFALDPGGYLLLGTAESADGSKLFTTVDKENHLFQGRDVARVVPLREAASPDLEVRDVVPASAGVRSFELRGRVAPIDLHLRLLEEYGPPSLIIDEAHAIVHLSERAGRYVRMGGGEASLNLLQLARPELRIPLRTALYQAAQKRSAVSVRGIVVAGEEREEVVDVIVRPALREGGVAARGYFLILFEEAARPVDASTRTANVEPAPHLAEVELVRIRAQMRTTVEQYEIQAEEAKAANEELQAINEELRSTAEELETSQEELRSVNEELQTVNQELKVKIDEITHANNDMRNLMSSTEIGTIFVDRSLRVKLFTPRARDIFNLIPADVGRALPDITTKLMIDSLAEDVDAVLDRLHAIEREVQTRDGAWHLMRLLPYRTADDRIDGVVLTFVNITQRKKFEEALRESEERHRIIVDSARDYAIVTTDVDARITSWSPGAQAVFGWTAAEIVMQPLAITFTPEDVQAGTPETERATARERGSAPDVRWHVRKDGTRVFIDGTTRVLAGPDGAVHGYLKIGQDVTDRRQTEEALRSSRARVQAIANMVPDLLSSFDGAGAADWFNERWLEYTGQTLELARGSGWTETIHPEDRERSVANFYRAVASGDAIRHEHRIRGAGGDYRWFLIQAVPLRDANDSIVRWVGAFTDIHEQRIVRDLLEEAVLERTRQLEELSAQRQQLLDRVVRATEVERQRIARELHDELGQHITALRVSLQTQKQTESFARMKAIVDQFDETVDRLTLELRPPTLDQLGLHDAIVSLAEEYSAKSGLRLDAHVAGIVAKRFGETIETTLYRVLQEALANVWKHAEASTVSIIVDSEGETLRMIIEDDGKGFDAEAILPNVVSAGRYGILGMRERLALVGGSLVVESQPGNGTTLFARVPVVAQPAES
ncbi:MAG TPA: CheR family methyltransferase [Thermoanaerobaculia bacterium]|jgi:two-component system CheB/CheR fusion protein|nr:CheR family methyltransferase [Thermoanaerobaculia bacterium]